MHEGSAGFVGGGGGGGGVWVGGGGGGLGVVLGHSCRYRFGIL